MHLVSHHIEKSSDIQQGITLDCLQGPTQFLYQQKAYVMHFSQM